MLLIDIAVVNEEEQEMVDKYQNFVMELQKLW